MSKHLSLAAGATAGGGLLVAMTVGIPMLVATGFAAPRGQGGGASGLITEGFPPTAAIAYQRAADTARSFDPPCEVPPWILAGVGEVESGHGTYGGATTDPNGNVSPLIIGTPLPHLGGDTDGGVWDQSNVVDHAVGPMQFIPQTWSSYGLDGNNDGLADPHNIYDAALTAAAYLCASGSPMATEDDWRRGLYAYNHSDAYVAEVLEVAYTYRQDPAQAEPNLPHEQTGLVNVPGIGLTNASWAPQVLALLAAAEADGVRLTGSSHRDPDEQIALRKAHCGTTHYAIYEMPSSECSPPTARPGTSNHEKGLAIDFHNCASRSTTCYLWLAANASSFEIYNLPTEPWHWSTNGR